MPITNEDRKKQVIDRINKAIQHSRKWRTEARQAQDFYAGRQWDESTKSQMEAQGRIAIVFNRVCRTINAVVGIESQNRQEVVYLPRDLSNKDSGAAEKMTEAAKYVRDQADMEFYESDAFEDDLITGMGWTEILVNYEEHIEGDIKKERIDPLHMLWDGNAHQRNLVDSNYCGRVKRIPHSEFKENWPNSNAMAWKEFVDLGTMEPHDADNDKYYLNDQTGEESLDYVYVVQLQWRERKRVMAVEVITQDPNDPDKKDSKFLEKGMMEDDELEQYKSLLMAQQNVIEIKTTPVPRWHYYQAFVNGTQVLEMDDAPSQKGFTFQCQTGLRDATKRRWFGLVQLMIDPQKWANNFLSLIMFIMSKNKKGGLLAEKTAFDDIKAAERDWAKPDSIVWLSEGGLTKVQEKGQAQYPDGIDRLYEKALTAINDIPGVAQELMGLAQGNQPIGLELTRKQAAVIMLAKFFDNTRLYRKRDGRVLADMIREYMSDGRLIRVLSPDQPQPELVPLIKDEVSFEYDIVVDDAPSSPNQKERVFGTLSQIMPHLIQAGIPVPPEIINTVPGLPSSLRTKWLQMLTQPQEGGEGDEMQKLLQLQANIEQEKTQVTREKDALKHQVDQQKLMLENQKLLLQAKEKELENTNQDKMLALREMEMRIKEEAMLRKDEVERMKLELDTSNRPVDIPDTPIGN